jgi:hypothetical protein
MHSPIFWPMTFICLSSSSVGFGPLSGLPACSEAHFVIVSLTRVAHGVSLHAHNASLNSVIFASTVLGGGASCVGGGVTGAVVDAVGCAGGGGELPPQLASTKQTSSDRIWIQPPMFEMRL